VLFLHSISRYPFYCYFPISHFYFFPVPLFFFREGSWFLLYLLFLFCKVIVYEYLLCFLFPFPYVFSSLLQVILMFSCLL
ncbi:unnamed protein product, partial [Tenebrio molitor]